MTVICASLSGQIPLRDPVQIAWPVHGLVDIELISTWYIHFYSGITHTENGLYKAAILDYAAAFETFLESYLFMKLSSRYDKQVAE
jgi:hypothetical protein